MSGGPVTFGWDGFARGLRASPALVLGGVPFGLVTGLTAQAHGLTLAEATLMSFFAFAGSAQLLALGAWTLPVSFVTVNLTSLTVNLRFLLMGPLLAPWLDHLRGWRRWLSLFFMIDHNWALALKEIEAGRPDAAYLIGSGIPIWVAWVGLTMIGHLLGTIVAATPGHPVFFAALSVFIALLVPMWRGRADIAPWVAAAAAAFGVSRALPGTSWHIIAGAIAGASCGALRDAWRRRRCT
jgi:predicted branched-subunit amino acid permease